jgi:hypothetical protein
MAAMRGLCWIGLLTLAAAAARADTVYLVGGGTVEGVVTVKDGTVTVRHAFGCVTLDASLVERIEQGECALGAFEKAFAAVTARTPNPAARVWELRAWCLKQGLTVQARTCEERALEFDPDFEAARRALGFVRHQGAWLTRDEFQRAQGKVLCEGMWVTPEEKTDLERATARARLECQAQPYVAPNQVTAQASPPYQPASASYSYPSRPQRPSNVQQDDWRSAAYTPRYERNQDRYRYSSWQNQDRCRYSSWCPATVVWLNDPGRIGPTPWDWRRGLMIYTCGSGPTQIQILFRIETGPGPNPAPSRRR